MSKATFFIPGKLFTTKQSQLSQHKMKTLEGTKKGIIAEQNIFLVEGFIVWGCISQYQFVSVMNLV